MVTKDQTKSLETQFEMNGEVPNQTYIALDIFFTPYQSVEIGLAGVGDDDGYGSGWIFMVK